MLCIQIGGSL
jgi:hypothetical protein